MITEEVLAQMQSRVAPPAGSRQASAHWWFFGSYLSARMAMEAKGFRKQFWRMAADSTPVRNGKRDFAGGE